MDLTQTVEYKIEEMNIAKDLIECSNSRHPVREQLLESMETHIDILKAMLPHTRQVELPDDIPIYVTPIEGINHVLLGQMLDALSDADEIPILKKR